MEVKNHLYCNSMIVGNEGNDIKFLDVLHFSE